MARKRNSGIGVQNVQRDPHHSPITAHSGSYIMPQANLIPNLCLPRGEIGRSATAWMPTVDLLPP